MSIRKKARLTRRQQRQYNAILQGDASAWYNWAYPGWQYPNQPPVQSPYGYRNEWGAYHFALRWSSRAGVDFKRLQLVVIRSANAECAWRFARDVPGANIRRLQEVVLQNGSAEQLRKFAALVPGADTIWLENAAVVAEVMAM